MGITKLIKSMKRNKTTPHETGKTTKASKVCVVLDHPQQGENITAPQYTFRVGTPGNTDRVEISIDQGSWHPCRYSVGYWWYDWSGYKEGRYQAEARAWTKDGQVSTSGPRNFQVLGEKRKIISNT